MTANRFDKLVTLLKELFQLDKPELDFGFYRIMHARSAEVTRFLEEDLKAEVQAALGEYGSAERDQVERELEEAVAQAKGLGVDPDSADKVKRLRAKLEDADDLAAVEADVYDHLYRFFRRYYKDGDFISQRVYKDGAYAIPYSGEEVKLHWANADQYYIKTDEYLKNYSFRLRPDDPDDPMRVHFRLFDAAEGEHDNIKPAASKARVFVLANGDFALEEAGESGPRELVLRFEYRPATLDDWSEAERIGKKKPPAQKPLLDLAESRIASLSVTQPSLHRWATTLQQRHVKAAGERNKSRLRVHLERYTGRNTTDYFIHKNLGGFLRRELDFYLKNEVMRLDDIENQDAPKAERYLSRIRAIRRSALPVIDLLAALENFQKRLWLKKKFVVETSYCIRLGCIPDEFLPEVAANEAQRREWVELCGIDAIKGDLARPGYSEPLTVEFLKSQPTLMLDTQHLSSSHAVRFLQAVHEQAAQSSSHTLFRGENSQALRTITRSLSSRLDCAHLDPPYNTATSGFLYKNAYQHSSWLSMMEERLKSLAGLLSPEGRLLCHIDENEYERLHLLLDSLPLGKPDTLVWDKRNPMTGGGGIATQHEYVAWRSRSPTPVELDNSNQRAMADKAASLIAQAGRVTEAVKRKYGLWVAKNKLLSGGEKAYRYIDERGRVFQSVSLRAPEPRSDAKFFKPLVHPKTGKPCQVPPNGFSRTPETLAAMVGAGEILFGKDETTQPRQKMYLKPETRRQMTSVMQDATRGRTDLKRLGLRDFPYSHSTGFYRRLLQPALAGGIGTVLDYFAGSGTTGHAVIDLNREDGGDRRFILVEMGEHFDTVLLPRLKKVTYSPKWKDGKPVRQATEEEAERSPRLIKVIRLESYEDVLNNLHVPIAEARTKGNQLPPPPGFLEKTTKTPGRHEHYLLRYMLDVDTRHGTSLLDVERFVDPTAYALKVKRPGSDEIRETPVDLVETFNWLLGLRVSRLWAPRHVDAAFDSDGEGRLKLRNGLRETPDGRWWFRAVEGLLPDDRRALVIWRKRPGGDDPEGIKQDNLVLNEWFKAQDWTGTSGNGGTRPDVVYANGDHNLGNVRPTGATWEAHLLEEHFFRLMFEDDEPA